MVVPSSFMFQTGLSLTRSGALRASALRATFFV